MEQNMGKVIQVDLATGKVSPYPWSDRERELYIRCRAGELTADEAGLLLPQRPEFVAVWRYLASHCQGGGIEDDCCCMSR